MSGRVLRRDGYGAGRPVEGIFIAQLMAANEAALEMYQKGWAWPVEFFEARTKYLQLADKATRTVILLTERLDHHRGRGHKQRHRGSGYHCRECHHGAGKAHTMCLAAKPNRNEQVSAVERLR
jgi:hypothetical protein